MMKYIYMSAFLAIFSTKELLAQKLPEERTWLIKAGMLTLVNDFTFPTVQLTLEKKISTKFSIAAELGVQAYRSAQTKPDTSFAKWHGFRAGVEGRYYGLFKSHRDYQKPSKAWAEKYLSMNLFYRQNQYNSQVFYSKPNDTTSYNDCFATNKKAWGINLIFGIQTYKGRFVADFYGGAGFLRRYIKNDYREFDETSDKLQRNSIINGFHEQSSFQENSGTIANIVLGIRLGMRL